MGLRYCHRVLPRNDRTGADKGLLHHHPCAQRSWPPTWTRTCSPSPYLLACSVVSDSVTPELLPSTLLTGFSCKNTEIVVISSPTASSWARDQLQIPVPPALTGRFFSTVPPSMPSPLPYPPPTPTWPPEGPSYPRIHRKHLPLNLPLGVSHKRLSHRPFCTLGLPALLLPICMCIMRCAYSPPCSPL